MKPNKAKSKIVVEPPPPATQAGIGHSESESQSPGLELAEIVSIRNANIGDDKHTAAPISQDPLNPGGIHKPPSKKGHKALRPVEMKIELDSLNLDAKTESRPLNEETAKEYSQLMKDGIVFPPVDVYHDGGEYFLADGFHRVAATKLAGLKNIEARVWKGGRVDALRSALGANERHGLRRTAADKRYAVDKAIREFDDLSDRLIAEMCRVSATFVGERRKVPITGTVNVDSSPKEMIMRVGRDGKIRRIPAKDKITAQCQTEQEAPATCAEESTNVETTKTPSDEQLAELRERIAALENDLDRLIAEQSESRTIVCTLLKNHLEWTVAALDLFENDQANAQQSSLVSSAQTDSV